MAKKSKTKPRTDGTTITSINNNNNSKEDDYYDIRKWTSRHYDMGYTTSTATATAAAADNDNNNIMMNNEAVERDLYKPKLAGTNKKRSSLVFDDANNGGEGADEDGIFLR